MASCVGGESRLHPYTSCRHRAISRLSARTARLTTFRVQLIRLARISREAQSQTAGLISSLRWAPFHDAIKLVCALHRDGMPARFSLLFCSRRFCWLPCPCRPYHFSSGSIVIPSSRLPLNACVQRVHR